MYSIKGVCSQKFKRKIVAIAFAAVLLAEFGEFFVPKNGNAHFEIPEHVPEASSQTPVHKKEKPQVQHIHHSQTRE